MSHSACLQRVDSCPSPERPPTARLRRIRSFAGRPRNRGGSALRALVVAVSSFSQLVLGYQFHSSAPISREAAASTLPTSTDGSMKASIFWKAPRPLLLVRRGRNSTNIILIATTRHKKWPIHHQIVGVDRAEAGRQIIPGRGGIGRVVGAVRGRQHAI